MNLIDYNQAVEALDKERQLLINREQYGAENVLVHHALNVISELPIIRVVTCKNCKWKYEDDGRSLCGYHSGWFPAEPNWFCADGVMRE